VLAIFRVEEDHLLTHFGFPGEEIPIIRGDSLTAYNKPDDPAAIKCIGELMDAIDAYIPEPAREVDKPFLMAVEDVFSIEAAVPWPPGRMSAA